MREKLLPWIPAIFCACLSLITFVAFVVMSMTVIAVPGFPTMAVLTPFLSFLPICFLHVGNSLSQLRQENRELREQIQKLISKSGAVELGQVVTDSSML